MHAVNFFQHAYRLEKIEIVKEEVIYLKTYTRTLLHIAFWVKSLNCVLYFDRTANKTKGQRNFGA